MKPKTINDFIKQLKAISPNKRELPLVIETPNGMEVYPTIKMGFNDMTKMLGEPPDKMVITF